MGLAQSNLAQSYRIRDLYLPPDNEELLSTKSNLAHAESAEDNWQEALRILNEVEDVRSKQGPESRVPLALIWLAKARAFCCLKEFAQAKLYCDKAMLILGKEYGPDGDHVSKYVLDCLLYAPELICE